MERKRRVIALGFFDGVHRGHGALLNCVKQQAERLEATPSVLTFDTHPNVLTRNEQVELINSPAGRVDLIERFYGIHDVLIIHFDREMRSMGWEEFLERLQSQFGAVHLVVGHDFRFGYRGEGNAQRLREKCGEMGIGCDVLEKVTCDGETVSSTYVRELIRYGDMATAARFLGHPHTLVDTVRYGYRLGRTIGAPTINMTFPEGVLIPAFGVYAAKVYIGKEQHLAVTNVGVRPTVGGKDQVTVESYILDYSGDLYGRQVRVEFFEFLRPEMKFGGVEQLKDQIQRDAEATRQYFQRRETSGDGE